MNYCGISPLLFKAFKKKFEFEKKLSKLGVLVFKEYPNILKDFKQGFGKLLRTSSENISFVRNTAEGLSLIANGYPFEPNDEILSYVNEYPSNHYPWKLQELKKRAKLKLIPDNRNLVQNSNEIPNRNPIGFTIEDIETLTTKKTKIIAISSVQFTSGFAADLRKIGQFCKDHKIDLVVDAAQSLGAIPLYPEEYHISAIASSGWKWLLGPLGSGILYTSPEFRNKIEITMAGADLMIQGNDYLNHQWQPFTDGRKFEYSTMPYGDILALNECVTNILEHQVENIRNKIFFLHLVFKKNITTKKIKFLNFNHNNESPILSIVVENPEKVASYLKEKKIITTVRGNYLRIAPHYMTTEEEIVITAEVLNSL